MWFLEPLYGTSLLFLIICAVLYFLVRWVFLVENDTFYAVLFIIGVAPITICILLDILLFVFSMLVNIWKPYL